ARPRIEIEWEMTVLQRFASASLVLSLISCATSAQQVSRGADATARPPARPKPRVVVTTDPELDDANSLLRYLLYSTDFQTEGLIYASSQFHWKGDGTGKKVSVPNREYSRWDSTCARVHPGAGPRTTVSSTSPWRPTSRSTRTSGCTTRPILSLRC